MSKNKNAEKYEKAKKLIAKGTSIDDACKQVKIKRATYGYYLTKENVVENKNVRVHAFPKKRRAARKEVTTQPPLVAFYGSPAQVVAALKEVANG